MQKSVRGYKRNAKWLQKPSRVGLSGTRDINMVPWSFFRPFRRPLFSFPDRCFSPGTNRNRALGQVRNKQIQLVLRLEEFANTFIDQTHKLLPLVVVDDVSMI